MSKPFIKKFSSDLQSQPKPLPTLIPMTPLPQPMTYRQYLFAETIKALFSGKSIASAELKRQMIELVHIVDAVIEKMDGSNER